MIAGARALLLALLMLVGACASTADAGVPDGGEGCGCSLMANQSGGPVRTVYTTDLPGYDPNAVSLHVGDWVADNSGSGPLPRQVVRPSVGGPLALWDSEAGPHLDDTTGLVVTPGGAGSFAATISVIVRDRVGVLAVGELVDVDIILAADVVSLGISGGIGVLSSKLQVTTSARVRAITDGLGELRLALVGTSATAYRITATCVRANSGAIQTDAFQILAGTLP